MLNHFIHIQYCYTYLVDQIPMGLLLYSHIPTALIALVFGIFVFYKSRNLLGLTLFMVCGGFFFWCLFDLSSWFAFLGSTNTMFTWSLLDFVALLMFFFSYYFLYVFILEKDLPFWQKIVSVLVILPTAIFTMLGRNLSLYDANACTAVENSKVTMYPYFVEGLFIVSAIVLLIVQYLKNKKNNIEKKKILFSGLGIIIFLFFFFSATLTVNLFASSDASSYVYNYEIYGLFGLPILLVFLSFLILKYKLFNIKLIRAQLLVIALLVLLLAQLTFLNSKSSIILDIVTVILTAFAGVNLINNVKREIEQKDKLEQLRLKLEESNLGLANANEKLKSLDKLKSEFLSLAAHQLRSPLTAIKGYSSMLDEGSYGKLADDQDEAVRRIYASAQGLINIVEDLLNISKIEQGGMVYSFSPIDLGTIVTAVFNEMQIPAQNKNLELRLDMSKTDKFMVVADATKVRQIVLNLIDNAIKYTPKGFVAVHLNKKEDKVVFAVSDSGVGISPETKDKLFQKFSRGEGGKLNTGGSGLGLYLAKQIAAAHKGDVVIDSEGLGKGSTFSLVLPMAGSQTTDFNVPS